MPAPILPAALLAKYGVPAVTGATGVGLINQMGDKIDATRGYMTGYDTNQTPFEVAKERGLAGVLGGTIDTMTGGMTDLDKRGDSKKQEDVKKFLNKFIYGTEGRG